MKKLFKIYVSLLSYCVHLFVNVATENLTSEIQVGMHKTKHCCSGDNTPSNSGGTRFKSGPEDHQSQRTLHFLFVPLTKYKDSI